MKAADILYRVFGRVSGAAIRDNNFTLTLLEAEITNEDTFRTLKEAIEKDGLKIEGIFAAGRQALLFKIKGVETGLLRLEAGGQETKPLSHPLVLRHALRKIYITHDATGQEEKYVVSVVPLTEEAGQAKHEDYVRTYVGFKRTNHEKHVQDVDHTQVSYLRNNRGELIAYPDGTPIAFFHDINSTSSSEKAAIKGFGAFEQSLQAALKNLRVLAGEEKGEPSSLPEVKLQKMRADAIAKLRRDSKQGKELQDDAVFFQYMKSVYTDIPRATQADIDAAKQQSEAVDRLRKELGALGLVGDLQSQLSERSEWENPSVVIRVGRTGANTGKSVA